MSTDIIRHFIDEYNRRGAETIVMRENVALSALSTFRVGGPADIVALPSGTDAFRSLVARCEETGAPYTVTGKCSNLLFDDAGYRGVIISTVNMNRVKVDGETITADAGVSLNSLALEACRLSLEGLSFSYGKPGSVGGAVCMNAGAFGGCMADVVASVGTYHAGKRERRDYSAEECRFGYRHSAFTEDAGLFVLSATFKLKRGSSDDIRREMDARMEQRIAKQPLDMPSAGSFFKRPSGAYAGELIERCGLKGTRVGGAAVSEKHAGFIVNAGGATCSDILKLSALVHDKVLAETGVSLEREVVCVAPDVK